MNSSRLRNVGGGAVDPNVSQVFKAWFNSHLNKVLSNSSARENKADTNRTKLLIEQMSTDDDLKKQIVSEVNKGVDALLGTSTGQTIRRKLGLTKQVDKYEKRFVQELVFDKIKHGILQQAGENETLKAKIRASIGQFYELGISTGVKVADLRYQQWIKDNKQITDIYRNHIFGSEQSEQPEQQQDIDNLPHGVSGGNRTKRKIKRKTRKKNKRKTRKKNKRKTKRKTKRKSK